MGSHPTLDPTPTRPPATHRHGGDAREELLEHLQTPATSGGHAFGGWPVHQLAHQLGGDLTTLHEVDHTHLARELGHRHPERDPARAVEQAFDRLNPTFGVPADHTDRLGHRDLAQRERALALGVRVAVHDSRQNDPNPAVWQPSQNYRIADAIQRARAQPTRTRWGPERTGPER
jgi:hypothetical protein